MRKEAIDYQVIIEQRITNGLGFQTKQFDTQHTVGLHIFLGAVEYKTADPGDRPGVFDDLAKLVTVLKRYQEAGAATLLFRDFPTAQSVADLIDTMGYQEVLNKRVEAVNDRARLSRVPSDLDLFRAWLVYKFTGDPTYKKQALTIDTLVKPLLQDGKYPWWSDKKSLLSV